MYSAVIFDLGHTLFDFDADFEHVIQRSYVALCRGLEEIIPDFHPDRKFQARFHEYKMKQYIQRDIDLIEVPIGIILRKFLEQEGFDVSGVDLRPALDDKYSVTQAHWVLVDGAKEVIEEIKSMGLAVGIISNAADDADVHNILQKSGVLLLMDLVISSAACGYRKPHPAIFNQAEQLWNHKLKKTIMVGNDFQADIYGGNKAGMFTIWTKQLDPINPASSAEVIIPDRIIQNLLDLPDILRKLIAFPPKS